jgi:ferredoxin-thioredoxin reductase catalytic subunit
MVLISMIVSGLALLAASVCLCLLMQEKKRNQKQKADACNYADACMREAKAYVDAFMSEAKTYAEELLERFKTSGEWEKAVAATAEEKIADAVNEICNKMSESYFSADINAGLGNILGFDPYASLQKQREKERGEQ